MSVALDISRTIHHMIVIKGQKMAQNDKKIGVSLYISGTIHCMTVIFGTHV